MRFFGNNIETIVTTDNLDRAFIIQSVDFYKRHQFEEINPQLLKNYDELEFSDCVDLELPEAVLEIVGCN